ncbi:MAG TPA: response regulator [Terriglobia bacterium]|nr:response regulator [Terriglobia bacterium]
MLPKKLFALLVASELDDCIQELKAVLKQQQIEIYSAETCEEVERLLDQTHPELVFTAKLLNDGTWRDVIHMAENVSVPTNVIVVSHHNDIRFYISAMDYGAFDFILPPFETDAIAHAVRMASESVRRKRVSQAMEAVA